MADSIAYQNKDITSKLLSETFVGKSLSVYGVNLPRIKGMLPTNLPVIWANELRLDNLFELEDGSLLLIDYESVYGDLDKITYGQYMLRIAERYRAMGKSVPMIRLLIIYTADVRREQVSLTMDRKGFLIRMEAAFLSELDSESIRLQLAAKVKSGAPLTEEDMMRFIILPLSFRDKEKKVEVLQESVALAAEIEDDAVSRFILSGLVVFSDKIIDAATREKVWRLIRMTKIGQMFLDEMDKVREEMAEQVKRAEQKAEAAEQKVEAAEQKVEAAEQKAEAAEQKAEQEQRAKQKAEQESARLLSQMVENLAKADGITAEDACRKLGVSLADYANAVLRTRIAA